AIDRYCRRRPRCCAGGGREAVVGVAAVRPRGQRYLCHERRGGGPRYSFLPHRAVVPLRVLPRGRLLRHGGIGRGAQVRRHVEVLRPRDTPAAHDAGRSRVCLRGDGEEKRRRQR
ncbi:unnamed protein product, partial [Ectocarpus sp. 12 AP-2014]